jgi:hypothetical protein
MIRKLLPSALCIFLSPLLVAQQITQPLESRSFAPTGSDNSAIPAPSSSDLGKITNATEINIVTLDPISSKTTKAGSKIRFRVLQDLTVQNLPIIRAGTLLTGTVTRVTIASKKHHRDGQIRIRLDNLITGSGQVVRLTGVSPEDLLARKENRKDSVKLLLLLPVIAPIIPYLALMAIGMWNEGGPTSVGDVELAPCVYVRAYTVGTTKIRVGDLAGTKDEPGEPTLNQCLTYSEMLFSGTGRLKIE